jgi:hypothetical protein
MTIKQRPEVDGISKVALDKYEAEHGELEQGDLVTESGPRLVIVKDKKRGTERFYAFSKDPNDNTVQEISREEAEKRRRTGGPFGGPFRPGGSFGDKGPFKT